MSFCAAAVAQSFSDSVRINFRQSKIYLDPGYMDNRSALDGIGRRIERYKNPDSTFILTGVNVVGGASPEGSVKFNEWLSRKRAAKIFDYLSQSYNIPDSITSFTFLGRDWGGLRDLVRADNKVPYRDEVLDLLDEIIRSYDGSSETEAAGNLRKIKRLRAGVPYTYMYRHLFPTLRASKLLLNFSRPKPVVTLPPPPVVVSDTLERVYIDCIPDTIVVHDTIYIERVVFLENPCRPFYMDIRTNMLYDALAVPNIGAEFYLGKNLSIVGNWMYAWWKTDRRHRYWRTYGGDIALRYWFGTKANEKPLTGHHIGLYGGILTYDFEWGGKGYMGGLPGGTLWDKSNHFVGVEYGYSMPIAPRFNIDFNIGIGYLGGEYREYIPMDDCYVWQATKYRHWFGPTKAEVSLTWLIGCDNYNRKKGGDK